MLSVILVKILKNKFVFADLYLSGWEFTDIIILFLNYENIIKL